MCKNALNSEMVENSDSTEGIGYHSMEVWGAYVNP